MNKTLSTILTVLAVLALAAVIFFSGSMYARTIGFGPSMMYGPSNVNGSGPNMMQGRGPSMMGDYGYNNAILPTLTIDQTKASAEKYLSDLNNSGLEIAEIMIFENNGYVIVRETSTGIAAFELLVDSVSQTAYPEHGPNMMWNLKYGRLNHDNAPGGFGRMMNMMGGQGNMMSGWSSDSSLEVSIELPVTPTQAIGYAQNYLDTYIAGAVAEDATQFYGYYTVDFAKDGKVAGMLSVNGYSGQVFLHTWHGIFIEEVEFE